VVAGVAAVAWTGWLVLDPILALLVAAHIVWAGVRLLHRSAQGLMDPALPPAERDVVERAIQRCLPPDARYHALLTSPAGARRFASVHLLEPGEWSVHDGHHLVEKIEEEVCRSLPGVVMFTHLEPLEDPRSFEDQELFRDRAGEESP